MLRTSVFSGFERNDWIAALQFLKKVMHKRGQQKDIANPEGFASGLVYGNPLIDDIRQREGVDPEAVATAVLEALYTTFGPTDMTMPLEATMFTCTAT